MAEIQWHPEALLQKMKAASMQSLHDAGEIVLKRWGETIPHATGDLESHLAITDHPSDLQVVLSSTGSYAIRQELDDTLRHPDPTNPSSRSDRKAHAGRDALNENRDNITKFVQDRMR